MTNRSLTLMRWKNWVDYLEYADQARTEKQNYKSHLGGNVYCTITEGSACMDIRQYWKPQEEVIPTKKGLYLRPLEYIAVQELLTEIGRALPELEGVVPCYRALRPATPLKTGSHSELRKNTPGNK